MGALRWCVRASERVLVLMSPAQAAELRKWLGVLVQVHAETLRRLKATEHNLDSTLAYLQRERE